MIASPPDGRATNVGQAPEPDQLATVLKRGYLPSDLRAVVATDPVRFYVNHWPLGDIDNFSVSRYAYAQGRQRFLNEGSAALLKYAPWETRYYQAADELAYKAQGEYVSIADGGALAPEAWSTQWSDLLRAFSPIDQLPVTRLSVPYRIEHLPKVTGDVTIVYPGENASVTASQFSFGALTYTARKSGVTIGVSNEMMRDAPFTADQVLRQSSVRAVAYDRDKQILLGQGGPQPTGLVTLATNGTISKYYPGTTVSGAIQTSPNAAIPSFAHLSQLRGKIHRLNGSSNAPSDGQAHCNGMIVHSRFEQDVGTLGTANGPWTDANGRPLWMSGLSTPATRTDEDHASDGALLGQVWALTNLLPTNSTDGGGSASSFVIAGYWEEYAIFTSQQVAYEATTEASYFLNDQTGVRVTARWDAGPIHPEAFAVMAGCNSVTP